MVNTYTGRRLIGTRSQDLYSHSTEMFSEVHGVVPYQVRLQWKRLEISTSFPEVGPTGVVQLDSVYDSESQ
jgi:hypothetical protein